MSTVRRPAQPEPQVDNLPRKMRLKVLYTFDSEKKENRLSRWPHMISTPVVYIDAERAVGIVELKTCLNSIAASSPELVATLGTNYSVYAYDYSEQDVPMVGLGILSWLLAAPNTMPYVTGRVCENNSPLFQASVKETLEVKFCLSPVPHFTQEDYLKSMTLYNALSKQIPSNFDPTAWSAFVTANPQVLSAAHSINLESPMLQIAGKAATVDGSICGKEDDFQVGEEVECQTTAYDSSRESIASTPALAHRVPVRRAQSTNSNLSNTGEEVSLPAPRRRTNRARPPIPSTISEGGAPSPDMASSPPTEQDVVPTDTEDVIQDHNSPSLPPMQEDTQETNLVLTQPTPDIGEPSLLQQGMPPLPFDNTFGSTAPSPAADAMSGPEKKPKKKYVRKTKVALTSDVPMSSDLLEAVNDLPPPRKRGRPLGSTKNKNGDKTRPKTGRAPGDKDAATSGSERPKPKQNTATVKERIGRQLVEALKEGKIPNYCANCGAIETSTWRRVNVKPNNKPEDADKFDILLCNPCGIWHHTKGTMRPQEFWDSNKPKDAEVDAPKKPRSRKRKMSAANIPQSEPQTEADEPINVPPPPPPPEGNRMQLLLPGMSGVSRKMPCTPSARSAREANAEWTMAVSAGARTARSSPVREGTADSPIELDQDDQPTPLSRNLFGTSPRNTPALEASPKLAAPRRTSPRKSPLKPITNLPNFSDKENIAPPTLKFNDRERETTPTAQNDSRALLKTPERRPNTLPRMTPQRMTPLGQSPWRALFGMTPKSARKSSAAPGSPSPASLERLLSHLNAMSPKGTGAFTSLLSPTTQRTAARQQPVNLNATFEFDDDLFSTDIAMPSSPPAFGFSTDIEGHDSSSSLWSELIPSPKDMEDFTALLGSLDGTKDGSLGNVEMTVDFSNFIEETENLMNQMLQKGNPAPPSEEAKSTE